VTSCQCLCAFFTAAGICSLIKWHNLKVPTQTKLRTFSTNQHEFYFFNANEQKEFNPVMSDQEANGAEIAIYVEIIQALRLLD
jgi:hypothetical protein